MFVPGTEKLFPLDQLLTGFTKSTAASQFEMKSGAVIQNYIFDNVGNVKIGIEFETTPAGVDVLKAGCATWNAGCAEHDIQLDLTAAGDTSFLITRLAGGIGITDIRPNYGAWHYFDIQKCPILVFQSHNRFHIQFGVECNDTNQSYTHCP